MHRLFDGEEEEGSPQVWKVRPVGTEGGQKAADYMQATAAPTDLAADRDDDEAAARNVVWKANQSPEAAILSPLAEERRPRETFGKLKVIIRCRPLGSLEAGHNAERLHIEGNTIVVQDLKNLTEARRFTFDSVLPPEADQAAVFSKVTPLVDHVLNGFHATVFAYGQTGGGKTFTMEGLDYRLKGKKKEPVAELDTPMEKHGIILRVIQFLFDRAKERQREAETKADGTAGSMEASLRYSFKCSYCQLYNEKITDLLNPSSGKALDKHRGQREGLRLRWNPDNTFSVENLFMCSCSTAEEMRQALFKGISEKIMGAHLLNNKSSRSHCLFSIYVECRDSKNRNAVVRRSELSLVDLAGSEKIRLLSNDPASQLVRESIEINKSLLALGKVITALAGGSRRPPQGSKAVGHIPYRESKLTMLLKHAIGGNSLTTMIACITPSDQYTEETLSTLLYAGRARNIENVPHINEDPTVVLIAQLRREIQQLREELRYYQALATHAVTKREEKAKMCAGMPDQSLSATGPTDASALGGKNTENLADSLLQACDMLKNLMGVNGQLREAYEAVKQSEGNAEEREVELNAENIALRERIEMLESIVWDEDLAGTGGDDHAPPEESPAKATAALPPHDASPVGRSSFVDPMQTFSSTRVSADVWSEHPSRKSHEASRLSHDPRGAPSSHRPALAGGVPDPVVVTRDTRERPYHRPPSPPHESEVSEDIPTPPPTTRVKEVSMQKKRREKNQKKFAKHLAEYAQRYRSVPKTESYAEYYGKARAKVSPAFKVHETIPEMEKVLRKVPAMLADYVPLSLKESGKFGTLSFGGTKEEVRGYEMRRREREERRLAALQKQRDLYATVEQDKRTAWGSTRETTAPSPDTLHSVDARDLKWTRTTPGVPSSTSSGRASSPPQLNATATSSSGWTR